MRCRRRRSWRRSFARAGEQGLKPAMRPTKAAAWFILLVLGGMCAFAGSARAADEEARVLILNGTDPYLPAYLEIDSAMRASLAQEEATAHRLLFRAARCAALPGRGVRTRVDRPSRQEVRGTSVRRDRCDQRTRIGVLQSARRGALAGRATRVLGLAWGGIGIVGTATWREGGRHATGSCGDDRRSPAACGPMRGALSSSPVRRISTGETSNWCGSRSRSVPDRLPFEFLVGLPVPDLVAD